MNIEIKNLKKNFKQGKNIIHVLDGVNEFIKTGEIIALLGKSGSGKSTMLSLLAGLERPDSGSIIIDGVDIAKLNEEALCDWRAHNMGIIFQQFHLIPHLTALENVRLSLEIKELAEQEKALEWLTSVGLADRAQHYPSMLSGGEQQRVALARAMVARPSLILADEPTGNLDVETGKTITELLFKMARENHTTMIVVTHDEELAQLADRIIHLNGGKCHS